MIEAMVLEISSQALDELGVQWDLNPQQVNNGNYINQKLDGANNSLVLDKLLIQQLPPHNLTLRSLMFFVNLISGFRHW